MAAEGSPLVPSLAGRRVLVVGAGRTGVAVARFALDRGAQVTLCDDKSEEALAGAGALAGLPPSVRLEAGGLREATCLSQDLIVLSPGVPPRRPVLVAAQQAGVAVTGELELASGYLAAPVVAITGTNGKSTVTSLAGEIARQTGRPTFVGGNLGTPLIEAVGTDAALQHGIVVCECSSYQLETSERFHPRAAALLNITPDHLERHGSMEAYGDAKLRIARRLGPSDVFVVNDDDPEVQAALGRFAGGPHQRLGFTTRPGARPAIGGFVDGGDLVLRLPGPGGVGVGAGVAEERYPTHGLRLVGRHNLGNALAAFLLLRGAGLASFAEVLAGARAFRPLSHRMELVGERGGVGYFDDSKGTNVAAVVASIDGFPRLFVLIAGGRDKGGSYAPLREALSRNVVRGVVVLGEAAERIAEAVFGLAPVVRAASLEEAVARAAALCTPGDAVVLSPACSSFDMFRSFEHRGQVFRAAVENLPPPV